MSGTVSDYLEVPAGARQVQITAADDAETDPVRSLTGGRTTKWDCDRCGQELALLAGQSFEVIGRDGLRITGRLCSACYDQFRAWLEVADGR